MGKSFNYQTVSNSDIAWLLKRSQQQADLNRRIYYPANGLLFSKAWYVLDEILNIENVLNRFNKLVELWALPGCQAVANDYINYLDKHPEWNDIKSFAGDVLKYNFTPVITSEFQNQHDKNTDFDRWVESLTKFVLESFNTEQNFKNKRYKVSPDNKKSTQLLTAITLRSLMSFHGLDVRNLEKYQYTNLDATMTSDKDDQNARKNRKLTKIISRFCLKMEHSQKLRKDARMWIGCRVIYSGPEGYCRAQFNNKKIGVFLDPRNVGKDIKPFDIAVGYPPSE